MHTDGHGGRRQGGQAVNGLTDEALRRIELGLERDDPDFVLRVRLLHRAYRMNVAAVFSLLTVSAVLFFVGLATQTWFTWVLGGVAFVGSFAIDDRFQRKFGQGAG